MDWLQKSQEMMKGWMDTQEKMWKSWTDAVQTPDVSNWDKTMKTWENSLKNFVESQALWARSWVRNLSENADFAGMDDYVKTVEEMTNAWVQAQQQLWSNWFQMIKKMDPQKMSDNFPQEAMQAMSGWQGQMEELLKTQQEWLANWTSIAGDDKE